MAEENKDQKTEEASSKRVRETEEKGQFAHSKEVSSAFVLLAGISSMYIAGQQSTHTLMKTWTFIFSQSHTIQLIPDELFSLFKTIMADVFLILAPILLTVMVAGVVSNLIQTQGLKISLHPLIPKFSKLNPANGIGRIFSKNSFSELIKSLFKISAVGLIAFYTIRGKFHLI
ncbi:MAG: EscU/YscU/HrcU family type III secretion system export apparatus switch protein, partial [Nitrospinales bacterium]